MQLEIYANSYQLWLYYIILMQTIEQLLEQERKLSTLSPLALGHFLYGQQEFD